MWFQILGGLVVERDGRRLAVGPPKRRLLLAVLLCRPGDVVPIPDLAEALWRGEPPASAAGNLRYYMHQIRQLLGSDSIVRRGAAYGLMIEPTQVDAWRFAGLAAEGEAALGRGDLPATRRASREALALWRGAPFEGMADEPALASDVARWEELRLAVMERNFDAELGLGSGADLVAEVRAAVAEQPFRERFHGQLMHALYRAGRRAEALTAFRDARGLLVQELGIEPGPDLIVLHRAVLRDDPGLKTPPRVDLAPGVQIPATPRHFGGRSEELGRLTELARPDAAPAASLVVVVGPPGVGKTALVVRWAHGAADRFPDGQLFLDLQGFHRDRPMRPMEAVAHLLVRLGVAAPDVPPQLADAVARYRSLLAGRRMLIVLDNVRSADQVVDLLAGTASTAVVATSRHGLPALVAGHGARQLELQSLGGVEAVRLLGRVLGDRRVAAEPEAATVLADACGRLPLALCISAAILADRPDRRIAEHLADLRRDGLAALDVDGDGRFGLTATFDLSCDALAEPDRRAFRLLGLIPGADFTPDAVAALVGLSQEEAAWLLGRLVRQHLVEARGNDRYALHDLLREYARSRAAADGPDEVADALARLCDHLLRRCDAAARALHPHLLRLPWPEREPRYPEPPPDEALAWLHGEVSNLVAAGVDAAARLAHEFVYRLADLLRGYFWGWRRDDQWHTTATLAVTAAAALGDRRAEALAELSLGNYRYRRSEKKLAAEHYRAAGALCESVGWLRGQAAAVSALAAMLTDLGELESAVKHFEVSLALVRRSGETPLPATYNNLAGALMNLGRLDEAAEYCRASIDAYRVSGAHGGEAVVQANLALVLSMQGSLADSRAMAEDVLQTSVDLGRPDIEADAKRVLALVCREAGDLTRAVRHAEGSLALCIEEGDRFRECQAHNALGAACHAQGRLADALAHHEAARALANRLLFPYVEVESMIGVAAVRFDLGEPAAARAAADAAVAASTAAGFRILQAQATALVVEFGAVSKTGTVNGRT